MYLINDTEKLLDLFNQWGIVIQVVIAFFFGSITVLLMIIDHKKSKMVHELKKQTKSIGDQLSLYSEINVPRLEWIEDYSNYTCNGSDFAASVRNMGSRMIDLKQSDILKSNSIFTIIGSDSLPIIPSYMTFKINLHFSENGRDYDNVIIEFKDSNSRTFFQTITKKGNLVPEISAPRPISYSSELK